MPLTPATIGAALHSAHEAGALDLPLPGGGSTLQRWQTLAELAATDLSLARLAEGHADAVAILAELAGPREAGLASANLWGVWAAEPPGNQVQAVRESDGWRLTGRKAWCSGAQLIDRALLTARAADGRRLFAVDVGDTIAVPGTWHAVGMAASGSLAVDLPGRTGRRGGATLAATSTGQASGTAAPVSRPAGTAGRWVRRAPCCPWPGAATWVRTPCPTSERWTP